MEREGGAFLATVADAYLRIAEEHPERFVVIDAAREPAAVFDDVRAAIDKALNERHDHERRLSGVGARALPCPAWEQSSIASRVRRPPSILPAARGRASAPRLRARRARGVRQVARRPGVRGVAPVPQRRLRHVPGLHPGASRASSRTSSSSSPRGATSTSTRSATRSGSHAYRTAPEPGRKVFVDPRGRPPVARRRGHPAEGARGAAARHRVPAPVGPGPGATRHDPQPLPRRRLRGARPSPSSSGARGRGRRSDPRAAGGSAVRRQPRARAPDGDRPRRAGVPRRRGERRWAGPPGVRARRWPPRPTCWTPRRPTRRGLRAELDEELAPFLDDEGQAGGGLPGNDPADRDPVRAPGASGRARSGRPDPAGCLGDPAGSRSRPRCRRRPACGSTSTASLSRRPMSAAWSRHWRRWRAPAPSSQMT